jgi:hypothetical protein
VEDLTQAIRDVIQLSRAVPRRQSEKGPPGDAGEGRPSSGPGDPYESPEQFLLEQCLDFLPPALLYGVAAVYYFGRGDYGDQLDFLECYAQVSDHFPKAKWLADELAFTEFLADYLEQGLWAAAAQGVDLDEWLET